MITPLQYPGRAKYNLGLAVYDAALTGTDLAKADRFFKVPVA